MFLHRVSMTSCWESAQYWMNLQNDYDLRMAEAEIDLKKIRPRKELVRAGANQ